MRRAIFRQAKPRTRRSKRRVFLNFRFATRPEFSLTDVGGGDGLVAHDFLVSALTSDAEFFSCLRVFFTGLGISFGCRIGRPFD
jgi:hypothetical protein